METIELSNKRYLRCKICKEYLLLVESVPDLYDKGNKIQQFLNKHHCCLPIRTTQNTESTNGLFGEIDFNNFEIVNESELGGYYE